MSGLHRGFRGRLTFTAGDMAKTNGNMQILLVAVMLLLSGVASCMGVSVPHQQLCPPQHANRAKPPFKTRKGVK